MAKGDLGTYIPLLIAVPLIRPDSKGSVTQHISDKGNERGSATTSRKSACYPNVYPSYNSRAPLYCSAQVNSVKLAGYGD